MIYKKAQVKKLGKMAPVTKANTVKARSMVKATTSGVMVVYTKVTGMAIKSKVTVLIDGPMEENSLGNGQKTKCMGKAPTLGQMVVAMKACTKMT